MANEDNNKKNVSIWNILEDTPADKDMCRAMGHRVSKLRNTEGAGGGQVVFER